MVPEQKSITPDQMRLVLEVSRKLAITTDLDPLLLRIAEATCDIVNCERASIFLHDSENSQLWTKIALQSTEIRVPDGAGIVGASFSSNTILEISDPYSDARFNPANDLRTGFVTRSILAAPMSDNDGKPLGVIQAINNRGGAFAAHDRSLIQLLADQAGVAIQRNRLQQASMEIHALRREMDLARNVQFAMIPKKPPVIPGIVAAGWTIPASTTGGDVFDLWITRDGRMGIFLGDASGHGLAPTLVVMQVRTLVRALSDTEPDPLKILSRINSRLAGDLEPGRFVTAFLGFMTPSGEISYCSAGHGPMVLRTRECEKLLLIEPCTTPLGVLDNLPCDKPSTMKLEKGGMLTVLSDGIFEAHNTAGEMFGIERVCETLDAYCDKPPKHAIDQVYTAVHAWQRTDDPEDDQTIVLVAPES